MHNSQKYEEPMLTLQVRPNEIIAINLAIAYFSRYCQAMSPVYEEACQLFVQYQRRLAEQLPHNPSQGITSGM
ncbi:MAG TPA: hypothetical protein VKR06_27650 [Ktedonosporobacter sp.]|nr:hypothetical protein [Ktedonosporobacter sp.]